MCYLFNYKIEFILIYFNDFSKRKYYQLKILDNTNKL